MIKAYMIRNKNGQFWNGMVGWSRFGDTGKTWKKKVTAEAQIGFLLRYCNRYKPSSTPDITDWQIVEVDLTPNVVSSQPVTDLARHLKIREEVGKTNTCFSSFLSKMRDKGVADSIEFIMDLEPTDGHYRVDRERIKEARAQIRGLGIKTRTYREYRGMFGFLDRQQAMQARLVLNVKQVVDVAAARKKVDGTL